MGIISEKYLKKVKAAEDAGDWSWVLYLLEQAMVLARMNYSAASKESEKPSAGSHQ
ncbi:unnamed protein product [marine sediment metagenome]|uniref:Uncharacterized protein n=1 Tax=marine sediment metagenome TaxID=412755 RepID=X1T309_9ZZZZ